MPPISGSQDVLLQEHDSEEAEEGFSPEHVSVSPSPVVTGNDNTGKQLGRVRKQSARAKEYEEEQRRVRARHSGK